MKALLLSLFLIANLLLACNSVNNQNVDKMVKTMENFHIKCSGESNHFRGSGERNLFRSWDNNYEKNEVDKAIEILKPSLLTDDEISNELLGNILLNLSDRVID